MKGVLSKIQPLHAPLIPPDGAEPQNVLVRGGRQLFRLVRRMARAVPLHDENGKRVYTKNPMTAEPLFPKNKHQVYTETQDFYLESQGNGNVEKMPYVPPTAEQLAADERDAKIAEMGGGKLGEALVDMGYTPAQLMERLMGAPAAAVPAPPVEGEVTYPHAFGVGRWKLSSGESMQGTKLEAIEAEKQLHQEIPEV